MPWKPSAAQYIIIGKTDKRNKCPKSATTVTVAIARVTPYTQRAFCVLVAVPGCYTEKTPQKIHVTGLRWGLRFGLWCRIAGVARP